MTAFKFFKHRNGISSFASISLELVDGPPEAVEWADGISSLQAIYGEAVRLGIKDALQWHIATGGKSAAFLVVNFTELVVDTKPDAARCAATGAAWKALGHDESSLYFAFDGEWRAKLSE
jgi:hypothetical protein